MKIEVTEHGPYEVSGGVPLRPKREVESEFGEPLTWQTGPPIETEATYRLCRCGKSDNKPFCDGSHNFEYFAGTERAPAERPAEGIKRHEGTGMVVVRDGELCEHAGFCGNRITDWFKMLAETEDTIVRGHLMAMLEKCPSGALSYEIDGEQIEPPLAMEIGPVTDGPLFVSGGIPIVMTDGEQMTIRNRVTLCRCGASKNKPLCDGTHGEIGFKA
jgi:CDGSH-type Zn-finger protein